MKSALTKVLYDVGCMLAAILLFCGVWNVFLAFAGPPYEPTEGISRGGAGASAFVLGAVLIVFLAALQKHRGDRAADFASQIASAAQYAKA